MKRTNPVSLLVMMSFGVLLGGCVSIGGVKQAETEVVSPTVTIKGVVKLSGTKTMITKDGVSTAITSRKLDLGSYDGKEVTVTGEFSGTTLFVDEVN